MLKIDLFAFGGGFASVPLMFHEFVEVRAWLDAQTFLNGIALARSLQDRSSSPPRSSAI
jgi:chromate transporter